MVGRNLYPFALGLATHLVIEPVVGARYLTVSAWLRAFSSWPPERRVAWQRARLAEVLAHARAHVPHYRERLGAAGADALAEDLRGLPVVDKAAIRADFDRFASDGWREMPHVEKRTGGTSGDPFSYPLDKRAWAHIYGAAIHFYERVGYRYGEPMVLLGAPASLGLEDPSWKARVRHRLEGHVVSLSGFEIDHATSLERARRAGAVRASLWYGYAGTIAAMAEAVLEAGVDVPAPRAIVTTSEPLLPSWKTSIERAFGLAPYDQYGCNDGGVLSQTCARGRFHLAENVSVVEILDEAGNTCPPGVEGDVTVTNLHARVLPFLRYRTGDRAIAGDGRCPCGTPGATLERVTGRVGDDLLLANGTRLSSMSFWPIFTRTPGVVGWQVVQPDPSTIRVRLRVGREYDAAQQRFIEEKVTERASGSVAVSVTADEPFERTPGGKHKVVVRQF